MRGTILLVEDFQDWRDLLSGLLRREGYQVDAVATLQQARDYLDAIHNLDLAILDIRLLESDDTNEDGLRLLAEIREKKAFTRVIMVTGHGTMEIQRRAFREFQAFDFFRKEQFDSEDFRKAVREAVEEAARERQVWKDDDYMRSHHYDLWQRRHQGSAE